MPALMVNCSIELSTYVLQITQLVNGDAEMCSTLVSLLYYEERKLVCAALRTVGNIITGDDTETQRMLDSGLLNALVNLFSRYCDIVVSPAMY